MVIVVGWSVFFGMFWLWVFEKMGGFFEVFVVFFYGWFDVWCDWKIGCEVV